MICMANARGENRSTMISRTLMKPTTFFSFEDIIAKPSVSLVCRRTVPAFSFIYIKYIKKGPLQPALQAERIL